MKKLLFILLLFIPSIIYASDLTIAPIDYVNGDATLLESNGEYLLIDVGTWENDNVINYLAKNQVTKFDIYLSHYDADHWGYNKNDTTTNLINYLMSQNGSKYTIKNLYIPAISKRSKLTGSYGTYELDRCQNLLDSDPNDLKEECAIYKRHDYFVRKAKAYGINLVELKEGSTFKVGTTTAKVLYLNTDATVKHALNNCSLVTKFTNGKIKFLTAGDIEEFAEQEILKLGTDITADIYKMSHHGGYMTNRVSNSPSFLKRVNPKYVYLQTRHTLSSWWKGSEFNPKINGGGYYYVDGNPKKELADIANLYSYWTLPAHNTVSLESPFVRAKFVVKDNEVFPVIENLNKYNGRTITINYIDKSTNQILKTKKYDFSLYSYVTDEGKNKNRYHLFNYKEKFPYYELDSGEDEVVANGVVDKDITYNIYYKRETFDITIKHVTVDGKPITAEVVKELEYGSSYTEYVNDNLLEKYEVVEVPENKEGTLQENTEVTFVYKVIPGKEDIVLPEEESLLKSQENISSNDKATKSNTKIFTIIVIAVLAFVILDSPKRGHKKNI